MKSALGQTWPRSGRISDGRAAMFGAGIMVVTAGMLAVFYGFLPRAAVLPALATACFAVAAVTALAAKLRPEDPRHGLTLWDVAGAMTFIGICVSALIAPEEIVQLAGGGARE